MADDPKENLTDEEKRQLLSDEIARKYDPDRLQKIVVNQAGRGERLDATTVSEMERRIGGRFGDVRVFRGPFAEAITRQHRADAVTIANTGMILMREGPRGNPNTALGKALLAHELTHVKQAQKGLHFSKGGGESQATTQEREAEAMEAVVHAEATGQPVPDDLPGDPARDQKVIDRVLELIEEEARLRGERLGDNE